MLETFRVEKSTVTDDIVEVAPHVPEIYADLSTYFPLDEELQTNQGGLQMPNETNMARYGEALYFLRQRLSGMTPDEKRQYLGLVHVEPGCYRNGTLRPIPDKRDGLRIDELPREENPSVDYPFEVSSFCVPNVLYEMSLYDRGGSQVRCEQSLGHFSPAVNAMQGNAASFINWLGELTGLELRLPTEAEWSRAVMIESRGKEYLYGSDTPIREAAHTFNPKLYRTLSMEELVTANPDKTIQVGGNVWNMTNDSIESDTTPIYNADGSIRGYCYVARGGGFQHCTQGCRQAPSLVCDPLTRSPSLGFRFVEVQGPFDNFEGGWRRNTNAIAGSPLFKESGGTLSTVKLSQTKNTEGLSLSHNGHPAEKIAGIGIADINPEVLKANGIYIEGGKKIMQLEHLLAALSGMGVWNARIRIDGAFAPPTKEFSALEYVDLIKEGRLMAGALEAAVVKKAFTMHIDDACYEISPLEEGEFTNYDVTIDFFQNRFIGQQQASFNFGEDNFEVDIAPARSFATRLQSGDSWARLGQNDLNNLPSLNEAENSPLLVATEEGWATPLRFDNEPARHKLLDLMGDMALLGMPIVGSIKVLRPGHRTNIMFLREIVRRIQEKDASFQVVKMEIEEEESINFTTN